MNAQDRSKLQNEIKELKEWINDLQSGMYINCVYCGHRYGPKKSTPVSMADCLKAHIEKCSKHPMSTLKAQNAALRDKEQERIQHIVNQDYALEAINGVLYGYEPIDESLYEKFPIIKKVQERVTKLLEDNTALRESMKEARHT